MADVIIPHKTLVVINQLKLGGQAKLQNPCRLSFYEGGREYREKAFGAYRKDRKVVKYKKVEISYLEEVDFSFELTPYTSNVCPICNAAKPDGSPKNFKTVSIEVIQTRGD